MNLINFYEWLEESFSWKVEIFNGLKIIIKNALGLLVHHGDKSFTSQTLNIKLYVGPIF